MRILLLVFLSFSILFANVGKITAVKGDVSVLRDGKTLKATGGFILKKGDQISTKDKSKALILFNDNTSITVGKKSSLNVDEFVVDENSPNSAKTEFSFNKGLFRTITGTIGKINPKGFKIKTKSASIGIRGTDFIVKVTPKFTQTFVKDGAVSLRTLAGVSVDIPAGMKSKATFGTRAPETPNVATQEDIKDMGADEVSDTKDLKEEPPAQNKQKTKPKEKKEKPKEKEDKKQEPKKQQQEKKPVKQKAQTTKKAQPTTEKSDTPKENEQDTDDAPVTQEDSTTDDTPASDDAPTSDSSTPTNDPDGTDTTTPSEATDSAPTSNEPSTPSESIGGTSIDTDNADTLSLEGGVQTVTADIQEADLNFEVVQTGADDENQEQQQDDATQTSQAQVETTPEVIPEVPAQTTQNEEVQNTPPTIIAGINDSVNEDETVILDVKGFDNEGDTLSYEIITQPTNGTATIIDGEKVQYTSNANYNGNDSLVLKVTDTQNESYQQQITFTVNPVNDSPEISLDAPTLNVNENSFKLFNITLLDTEDSSDDLSLNFSAENGTVSYVDTKLQYTPNSYFSGSDTITLTVTDKDGASTIQTIAVTVTDTTVDLVSNSPTGDVDTLLSSDLSTIAKEIVGSDNYMEFGYILNNSTDQIKQSTYISGDITPNIIVDSYIQSGNTATYNGNIAAFVDGVSSGGDITLNMDFGNRNLTGTLNVSQGNWKTNINSGNIGSDGFSSTDISSATDSSVQNITGNIDGKYYGDNIQSVGGTFSLQSGSSNVNGVFGGSK